MENFLLIFDELDDAVAMLRRLAPQLLGFAAACVLFVLSILVIMQWPVVVSGLLALLAVVNCWPLLRLKPWLGFKTDP